MDRRRFLKTLGMEVTATQIAPRTLFGGTGWDKKKYPKFDPGLEYGYSVQTSDPKFDREACLNDLDEQIEEAIPPNYRNRIRYLCLNPAPIAADPLAQRGTVAWKYSPKHRKTEMWHE